MLSISFEQISVTEAKVIIFEKNPSKQYIFIKTVYNTVSIVSFSIKND